MPETIPDARSIFLPWVRQGAAGTIQTADTLAPALPARISVPMKLLVNGTQNVSVLVGLLGPAEVTGLDRQQIIRTDPKPGTTTFEPNYLAAIEFDRPDLPWLFTPAKPGADGKLRPWLCLVVLKKQPGVALRSDRSVPLPILEIGAPAKPADELPDLAESWAWAHAQISAPQGAPPDEMKRILASEPAQTVSRLLCPRLLQPLTDYLACLVPAFEVGRKAALNLPIPMTGTPPQPTDALAPAWPRTAAQVTLPVFYHWEFRTSPAGDFESLVRLLEARQMPPEVGRRPMDISNPGSIKLPATPTPFKILDLEGALRVPDATQAEWPATPRNAFQQELEKVLNKPATQAVPVLAPPIYGQVYVGVARPVDNVTWPPPHWLDELNLDPRERVAAAFGTRVVQSQQEELMASAWEQMGDAERANQRLRQEQLSLAINTVLHVKHFNRFNEETLLQVVAPAQARIVWANSPAEFNPGQMRSLQLRIASAVVPAAAVASAARRLTRARGAISRRAVTQRRLNSGSFIGNLNPRPGDRLIFRTGGAISLNQVSATIADLAQLVRSERATSPKVLNADDSAPPAKAFRVIPEGQAMPPRTSRPFQDLDNVVARNFRQAAAKHLDRVNRLTTHAVKPQLPLPEIKKSLLVQLNPAATMAVRVQATIKRPALGGALRALQTPTDAVRPVLAAPEFPQPMYEVLRDLSQELLLPGLDKVLPETVTLLETNTRFVEAFMVGLNTEMGRELLWRGFPTDQRGTFFQRFWDGIEPDIKPIHEWGTKPLGENLQQPPGGSLVLLIRGELLRRYPNAVIYAAEAKKNPDQTVVQPREPGLNEKYPTFRGTLQPDITFLGFDLTEIQAKGDPANPKDGGWFFIIQEQPTEPRFGFDTDVSFGTQTHVSLTPAPPPSLPLPKPPPTAVWRKNSAHMAVITRQQPVRIAIHATQMMR